MLLFVYVNASPFTCCLEQFFFCDWSTSLYVSADVLMITSRKKKILPEMSKSFFFFQCFKSLGRDNNQAPVTRQMRARTRFPTLRSQSSPASTPICTSSQLRTRSHKTGQPGPSLHVSAPLLRLPFNHMDQMEVHWVIFTSANLHRCTSFASF